MGKVVSCTECRKAYRNLVDLEDLRENDGICLVCNSPIEVEDWDRVLASYADDDFDDMAEDVDEDDFAEDDFGDDLEDDLGDDFDELEESSTLEGTFDDDEDADPLEPEDEDPDD